MRHTPAPRWLILLAAALVATVLVVVPHVGAAPPATCSNVTLVLDESGSIGSDEVSVRSAVNAFFAGLTDIGVASAIVEFGTAAKTVVGYTPITGANVTSLFGPYINATAAGDVYDSPSQLGAYTNWDDALDEVSLLNAANGVAPLVLFVTDGDPTAYNLDRAGESGGVFRGGVSAEALARAVEEADEVRAQGSHLIAVGVGGALQNPASVERLQQIAGPDIFDGSGRLDLSSTDVVLVPEFAELPRVMALIAQAMCADPDVTVTKSVSVPAVTAGTTVTYTIEVINTGNVPLVDVVVTDPLVPGCSATLGDLGVGEIAVVTCTSVVWAPLTNTATVTGTDPFGTPVTDDDSTTVTLVATGTGTPGYWKNHPYAWPVVGGEVLVGDWDHDGLCGPDETCLSLTLEEAMAALSTPPKGDVTWNLARPLVAAWLNASAGNDASCIAGTLEAATAWLLAHPMGSGVRGGDAAWQEASAWASQLDDYNNGRLCAESRDSASQKATQNTSAPASPPAKGDAAPPAEIDPGPPGSDDDQRGPSDQGLAHGKRKGHDKGRGKP